MLASLIAAWQREWHYLRHSHYQQIVVFILPLIMLIVITALFNFSTLLRIPVAVVDQDQSNLSRLLIRNLEANSQLRLALVTADSQHAYQQAQAGNIFAIVDIPPRLQRSQLQYSSRAITVLYHAAYRTTGSLAAHALVETIGATLQQDQLALRGASGLTALPLPSPKVQISLIGNGQQSFERFLTPLVLPAIFFLLLSCAAIAAVGRELVEQTTSEWLTKHDFSSLVGSLAGKLFIYVVIFTTWMILMLFYLSFWRGWPIAGNIILLIIGIFAMCWATCLIASALVTLSSDINIAFAISTIYASGAITYSDGTLPVLNANWWARFWANAMPYTHYYRLQIEQINLGSDISISLRQLLILIGYVAVAAALSLWRLKYWQQQPPKPFVAPPFGFSNGRQAFWATLATIISQRAILATILLSVIFYSFYYPAAYSSQVSRQLPVILVDHDHSTFSRYLERRLNATRSIEIVNSIDNEQEALKALRNRQVDAIIVLQPDLLRKASLGRGVVAIWLSAPYLVRAADIGNVISDTVNTSIHESLASLLPAGQRLPAIRLIERPLFNSTVGYGSFVVPAVATLIIQQTLLFGSAMLVALRRQFAINHLTLNELLASWAALTLIGCLTAGLMYGFTFWWQDYPRGGNPLALLLMIALLASTSAALGLILGSWLNRIDRAMQIYAGTSIALFFVSGASIPQYILPTWVIFPLQIFPSTTLINTFININAAGISINALLPTFIKMIGLLILLLGFAYYCLCHHKQNNET